MGSETGVMNAIAMEEMPKIVFLSHSTVENLTRDWVNTHSLSSERTVCQGRGNNEAPACHQLHFGWAKCTEAPAPAGTEELHKRKGSGVAQCQADIDPQDAYKIIWHVVQWRLEELAKRHGKPLPGVVANFESGPRIAAAQVDPEFLKTLRPAGAHRPHAGNGILHPEVLDSP